jgi:hypothetical protein
VDPPLRLVFSLQLATDSEARRSWARGRNAGEPDSEREANAGLTAGDRGSFAIVRQVASNRLRKPLSIVGIKASVRRTALEDHDGTLPEAGAAQAEFWRVPPMAVPAETLYQRGIMAVTSGDGPMMMRTGWAPLRFLEDLVGTPQQQPSPPLAPDMYTAPPESGAPSSAHLCVSVGRQPAVGRGRGGR